jgi:hypothetical protein
MIMMMIIIIILIIRRIAECLSTALAYTKTHNKYKDIKDKTKKYKQFNQIYTKEMRSLTNTTELSLSSEASSCAVPQNFPNILWNPKVH